MHTSLIFCGCLNDLWPLGGLRGGLGGILESSLRAFLGRLGASWEPYCKDVYRETCQTTSGQDISAPRIARMSQAERAGPNQFTASRSLVLQGRVRRKARPTLARHLGAQSCDDVSGERDWTTSGHGIGAQSCEDVLGETGWTTSAQGISEARVARISPTKQAGPLQGPATGSSELRGCLMRWGCDHLSRGISEPRRWLQDGPRGPQEARRRAPRDSQGNPRDPHEGLKTTEASQDGPQRAQGGRRGSQEGAKVPVEVARERPEAEFVDVRRVVEGIFLLFDLARKDRRQEIQDGQRLASEPETASGHPKRVPTWAKSASIIRPQSAGSLGRQGPS